MSNIFQRPRYTPNNSTKTHLDTDRPLTIGTITRIWFPLALSWIAMSFDGIIVSAILARMANAEINLAAYGGISIAIAFVFSAPISAMLSVSTALSRNWQAFARLRRFMVMVGLVITAIFALVALTPLYYWVAGDLIGAPSEILEPGRIGLILLLPFPFLVGYRRLHQGVLIRFGQASGVTVSTIIRIIIESVLMLIGLKNGQLPGIVVVTGAETIGMTAEMLYAVFRARPILKYELKTIPVEKELTWNDLLKFFIPLSFSTIVSFSFQFINSAGMSRMPLPVESLAIFPVVSSFAWMLQGPGIALQEVVVSLLDRKKSTGILRRFAIILMLGELLITLLILVTPLSMLWFTKVTSLSISLAIMANISLWYFLPQSGICVLQCWYQGLIIFGHRTRIMTEAMIVSVVVELVIMIGGVLLGEFPGIYVGSLAFLLAYATQIFYQYLRSRSFAKTLHERDAVDPAGLVVE